MPPSQLTVESVPEQPPVHIYPVDSAGLITWYSLNVGIYPFAHGPHF